MSLTEAMARKPRPFLMRGKPHVTAPRPTIMDAPDPRVPEPQKSPLTPEQLRALERPTALDPRVRPVERLLERWGLTASGTFGGGGSRGGSWPELAQVTFQGATPSGPTMLRDEEFLRIDRTIRRSPNWAQQFVYLRYRGRWTIAEIADEAGRRPRAVFEEQKAVLFYYLGRFVALDIHIPTWEPDA